MCWVCILHIIFFSNQPPHNFPQINIYQMFRTWVVGSPKHPEDRGKREKYFSLHCSLLIFQFVSFHSNKKGWHYCSSRWLLPFLPLQDSINSLSSCVDIDPQLSVGQKASKGSASVEGTTWSTWRTPKCDFATHSVAGRCPLFHLSLVHIYLQV